MWGKSPKHDRDLIRNRSYFARASAGGGAVMTLGTGGNPSDHLVRLPRIRRAIVYQSLQRSIVFERGGCLSWQGLLAIDPLMPKRQRRLHIGSNALTLRVRPGMAGLAGHGAVGAVIESTCAKPRLRDPWQRDERPQIGIRVAQLTLATNVLERSLQLQCGPRIVGCCDFRGGCAVGNACTSSTRPLTGNPNRQFVSG